MKATSDSLQSEVYTNLINEVMTAQQIQITSLSDVNELSVLPKFTQILIGETIPGWKEIPSSWKSKPIFKQRITSQITVNTTAIMNHLSSKDKAFKFMKPPETETDLIGFLSILINKFYVVHTKKSLVNIIDNYLNDFEPKIQITNMNSSWENGLPFIAMLAKASSGSIQYDDKGNGLDNYNYIKEGSQKLNIPFVLTEKCISNNPDENCTCIQAAIFIKSLNLSDSQQTTQKVQQKQETKTTVEPVTQQNTNKDSDEKKKFEEKIDNYKKIAQTTIDLIENEHNELEKMNLCMTEKDIQNKRNFIHQFQSSKKKNIMDSYYRAKDSWDVLERNSNRTKIPIPNDLFKVDDLKKKIDSLDEKMKTQNDQLASEEKKVKDLLAEVEEISNLVQAREKYDELKGKIDLENWKHLQHNNVGYVLCLKIETLENQLKEKIENFQEYKQQFDQKYERIVNDIENNSDDLIELENIIQSLPLTEIMIDKYHKDAIIIDGSIQLDFNHDEYLSKINSVNKLFEENKSNIGKITFVKELKIINEECDRASSKIQKLDEYKNVYSTKLIETVKNEIDINIPDYEKLAELLEKIEYNEEFRQKFDEAKQLIEKIKKDYNDAFTFLESREEESKKIEDCSFYAHKKCKSLKKLDLVPSIAVLAEATELVSEAEKAKTWDDEAKGSSIDMYNEYMKKANEIIQNGTKIIEDKFNSYLEQVKESIDSVKETNMKQTDEINEDYSNYKEGLKMINDDIEKVNALQITDDKMKYDKKYELDELHNELDQMKEELEKLIDGFPDRIKDYVDSKCNSLENYDKKGCLEKLNSESSQINDLDANELDQQGTKYISTYIDFLNDKKEIEQNTKEFNLEAKKIDISDITDLLHDLIIIYRSTLLLKPKECVKDIKERVKNCSDSDFSLVMAFLYVNKFNEDNEKYEIEDISEAKTELESILDSDKNFTVEISKQICNRVKKHSTEDQIELLILTDFLKYLPEFEDNLKDYIVTSIGNNLDIRSMIDNLQEMEYIPAKIIEIFKSCLEKVNSLAKSKICHVSKDSNSDSSVIVCDFGSYETRVGLSGEIEPNEVFPTVVGSPKYANISGSTRKVVGSLAYANAGRLHITSPVENGYITNCNDMEEIMSYAFNRYKMEDHHVLCSETDSSSKYNRERIVQMLFEKYNAQSVCIMNSNVLSLYSQGRYTGLVADIGYKKTRIVPVYEGYSIPHLQSTQNYGGFDFSDLLLKNLGHSNDYLYSASGKEIIENIKRNYCYVPDENIEVYDQYRYAQEYKISDNYQLSIGGETILSPQILFHPSSANLNIYEGIHESIYNTIQQIDDDYRKNFFSNILICGGSSNFKGLRKRAKKEIVELAPTNTDIDVIKPDIKNHYAWVGGSIVGQLSIFPQMLMSRKEYYDDGKFSMNKYFL